MKRILFPTDYSKTAEVARDFAIFLAKKSNAELIFLNSFEIPASQSTVISTTLLDTMKENSEQGLDDLKNYMQINHPDLSVSYHSVLGQTVSTICDLAESTKSDLIIMGTRGASGFEEIFMGSTAQAVIKHSKVAVLAIPHYAKIDAIKRIAYSSDFNFKNVDTAHNVIEDITKIFKADLSVVHFTKDLEFTEDEEILIRNRFKDLDIKYDEIPLDNYEEDIEQYIDFSRTNILCMIRRPHSFLERLFLTSHSEKRAMHTEIPLLVLKEDN